MMTIEHPWLGAICFQMIVIYGVPYPGPTIGWLAVGMATIHARGNNFPNCTAHRLRVTLRMLAEILGVFFTQAAVRSLLLARLSMDHPVQYFHSWDLY